MADESQVTPSAFVCEGGLIANRSTFIMKPGEALQLENFEPDVEGGYKRIKGYQRHVRHVVPQTASSDEPVLLTTTFANKVIVTLLAANPVITNSGVSNCFPSFQEIKPAFLFLVIPTPKV